MPSRPTNALWARSIVYGRLDQKEWSNDFWYLIDSAPLPFWSHSTAAAANFAVTANLMAAVMPMAATILGVQLYVHYAGGTVGTPYYDTINGAISGGYLPEELAVIVRKQTATVTPDGKGRWYFTCIPQSYVTGSYLNDAGITAYGGLGLQLWPQYSDQGITYTPANFSPTTGLLYPLVACEAVSLLGTRRRRRFRF